MFTDSLADSGSCTALLLLVAQVNTGLSLKATAGLRLLPGNKADDILAAVRTYLATLPFKVKSGRFPCNPDHALHDLLLFAAAFCTYKRTPSLFCGASPGLLPVVTWPLCYLCT